MSTYVLNTIAFKKDLDNGVSQSRLVEKVKQLGFDAIEIRNEFLNGSKNERLAIAKEAQKLGLEVFYSVNDVLVTGDHLNNKALDYVTEMKELNSSHLKLNIGSLSDISKEELLKGLAAILDGQFEIAVENNQTLADSSLAITKKFFEIIQDAGIKDIHYCFDIA
ncbi:phosphosulfolactate synthase, partial [Faecalibacillus intestinalis]|nr:phosphosulfolactate synthase [Faecalibacillus intestinalis]